MNKIIVILLVFLGLCILNACDSKINQPNLEEERTVVAFNEIIQTTYFPTSRSIFYIINNKEELDSLKAKFLYGSGDIFYSKLKDVNYSDTTLIGYTSGIAFGSGAQLRTDSLISKSDTISINYTFNTKSVYQDAVSHTSIVGIEKTSLPIKIGEFIYVD